MIEGGIENEGSLPSPFDLRSLLRNAKNVFQVTFKKQVPNEYLGA